MILRVVAPSFSRLSIVCTKMHLWPRHGCTDPPQVILDFRDATLSGLPRIWNQPMLIVDIAIQAAAFCGSWAPTDRVPTKSWWLHCGQPFSGSGFVLCKFILGFDFWLLNIVIVYMLFLNMLVFFWGLVVDSSSCCCRWLNRTHYESQWVDIIHQYSRHETPQPSLTMIMKHHQPWISGD